MSKLQALLIERDNLLLKSADSSIPPRERLALKLALQLTPPEPNPSRDLEWLLQTALDRASYVHIEPAADMAIFSFSDRSILAVLQSGMVYAVLSGVPESVQKIIDWLAGQGVIERGTPSH